MPLAIAINSKTRGPVVIPLHRIRIVTRSSDGTACVDVKSGGMLETHDKFEDIADRMTTTVRAAEQIL